MPIVHSTDEAFKTDVSDGMVLVDFWAEWCGPCKMMNPVFEELSEEMGDQVKIVKVDVDKNQSTSSEYGIMSIPTMLLMKDGEIVEKLIGFTPKEKLVGIIESHQ